MKHYTPTRRKKALRRFVTLLLLLCLLTLCGYHLLPTMCIKDLEEKWLLEDLHIAARFDSYLDRSGLKLPMLLENEHELLRTTMCFHPRHGWYDTTSAITQGSEHVFGIVDNNFHNSGYSRSSYSTISGKIHDDRIVHWEWIAVPVSFADNTRPTTPTTLPFTKEQWTENNNSRYFLLDVDLDALRDAMGDGFYDITMRCFDHEGALLEEVFLGAVTVS